MNQRRLTLAILLIGDFLFLYGALFAALAVRYAPTGDWGLVWLHIAPFFVVFTTWLFAFGALGLYDLRFMKNGKRFFYRLGRAIATNTLITIPIFYLLPFLELEPRRNLLLIAIASMLFIFVWRYCFNLFIVRTPSYRVLFFGVTNEAIELARELALHPHLGQKPIAFLSPAPASVPADLPLPHFTLEQNLERIVQEHGIDTIVILPEIKANKEIVSMLIKTIPLGIGIVEFTTFYEMTTGKVPASLIGEAWFLENLIGVRRRSYEFFKRVIDIAAALAIGIPALVLLPCIALGIVLSTPRDVAAYKTRRAREGDGIVFFRQKRVGKNGAAFDFIKFRSQVLGAEKMAGTKDVADDPRHYPFGTMLRRSYLDELPQIWNVLKGEMSFVGPRPERPEYVAELKQKIPFYEMRLLVRPGITGWAQINMENDASVEDAPEKMQYDLYYIKNGSPVLDLLVILRTVFAVLRRQGR